MKESRLLQLLLQLLADWPQKLTVLLTGLFLSQYLSWIQAEAFLLPETDEMLRITLWSVIVLQLFTRKAPAWLRLGLQLAVVIGITTQYADYDVSYFEGPLRQAGLYGVVKLFPWIWFSGGAWLLILFALWSVQSKMRIYTLILVTVFGFAVRDSFSLLVLWDEVAIVLFSGLFLLILQHLGELKRRSPDSWVYLSEYPIMLAGPIVTIIGLTMLLGTLAPDIRPMVPDPYTLWKNYRGETFTTGGKVSEPIVAGELRVSSSGYSRSDGSLGGSFDFDYAPVMNVDSNYRSYWRGETRSLYTGRGWEASEADNRAELTPVTAGGVLAADSRIDRSKLKAVEVKQTVTMLQPDQSYPVLFGAYPVSSVTRSGSSAAGRLSGLSWTPRLGELRISGSQAYPETYELVSQIPVLDEAGLREVSTVSLNPAQWEDYLQLPANLPQRVRQLALDVSGPGETMYDKVKLLEKHLVLNYNYTNKPDVSKGRSRDFVDRFLFDIKEGYCDYYSTAMVVMVRSLGFPARWVKGYAPGTTPADDYEASGIEPAEWLHSTAGGLFTVRNADAHSWVEVYFPGYGWIPFEPTSGFTLPLVTPEGEPVPLPEVSAETAAEPETAAGSTVHTGWVTVSAVLGSMALLAAAVWRYRKQLYNRPWIKRLLQAADRLGFKLRLPGRMPDGTNERVIAEFNRLIKFARRKGFGRSDHETIRETAAGWLERSGGLRGDLEQLLELFEKAKYSPVQLTSEEAEQAIRTVQKLREQM
ncbi:DUF4129 domain-containing transglutaminase family protein [Paenibacillus sp. y28]|uniref:DUF4129 domain-containing transglutaminase family protein n=1 Tax=Paenibacillus sp. y28 TaxID=3129110 RepID=UPI003017FA54